MKYLTKAELRVMSLAAVTKYAKQILREMSDGVSIKKLDRLLGKKRAARLYASDASYATRLNAAGAFEGFQTYYALRKTAAEKKAALESLNKKQLARVALGFNVALRDDMSKYEMVARLHRRIGRKSKAVMLSLVLAAVGGAALPALPALLLEHQRARRLKAATLPIKQ